ncbi:putative GATA transcription factor 22 isoform X2 [Iris pallida]|uniref:GATA transcription factor 22 isoform X2 n=1 Tax=Iris pallida TaxID=29817 RepID=A0AAX6HI49_IRIPA|nr:putative GATA transcription factor 22 isoform X2 [Iris pallida]
MKMEDQGQDQVQVHFPLSTISYDPTSAVSCPNLQSSQYDQGAIHIEQLSKKNHQSNERLSIGGSSTVQSFFSSTELALDRARVEQTDAVLPAKWMSSKMRLMRKMMMGEDRIVVGKQGISRAPHDQAQYSNPECSSSNSNSNSNGNGIIRVCSNCSTTKTPLWRSGPQGPKSLCNACGIRQMKARRAMRAAAAAAASAGGGGVLVPATAPKKAAAKEERLEVVDRTVPFKKRFKIATSSSSSAQKKKKKLRFDDITIGLSKKLAFNQTTFPQEEKDAAILLMALSIYH